MRCDDSDYSIDLHAQDLAAIGEPSISKVYSNRQFVPAPLHPDNCHQKSHLIKALVLNEPPVLPLLFNPDNPFQILSLFVKDFTTAKSFMKFGMKHMKPAMKALKITV